MRSETLNQREHDLVRYQRQELYQAHLITEDEYADLAKDHAAVRRLEDYDVLRAKLIASEAENRRLTDALKESQASAELAVRRLAEENERLRDALTDIANRKTLAEVNQPSFHVAGCPCVIHTAKRALSGSPAKAPTRMERVVWEVEFGAGEWREFKGIHRQFSDDGGKTWTDASAPCKTCGGTKLVQRGAFLSDQADKPCPDCAPAEGKERTNA